jgi:hypothetical protein
MGCGAGPQGGCLPRKGGGGGAISDRLLKGNSMMEYLGRGHAVRVMLTAQQRSLKDNANAIRMMLKRVRELVGNSSVEARGMKSNNRNSYGTLLLHLSKK